MIIEVTFELIACAFHSQQMSFIPYFGVLLYLISDRRKISLNTLNIASTCKHIFVIYTYYPIALYINMSYF
jgi:hypothetical protein